MNPDKTSELALREEVAALKKKATGGARTEPINRKSTEINYQISGRRAR